MNVEPKMFPVPENLVKDKRLTAGEKMLYVAIASGESGEFKLNEFADIIGRNIKTARKYLHHLIISGWITYDNTKSLYTVNVINDANYER